ncbi:MAG: GNAT family N-acetyltransferase [Bacteroidota bacterium]
MVRLVPIEQEDFDVFMERDIAGYAAAKVRSGTWLQEEALERSRQEHALLLPQGRQTPNHFIYSILDEDARRKIGILWVHVPPDRLQHEAFIYDIEIDEAFRGKGYGRQALLALDELLIGMGVEHVDLHVFAYNTTAFELYKKAGYEVTDFIMRKVYRAD